MNLGIETEYIEFKTSTSQTTRALESLVAMLNKHGEGELYFGVADNGDVIGQNIGNKTIKDLSDAIMTRIKNQPLSRIYLLRHTVVNQLSKCISEAIISLTQLMEDI